MPNLRENTETTPLLDDKNNTTSPVAGSKFYFIEKDPSLKGDRKVSG